MFGFIENYKNLLAKNTEKLYLLYKEKYGDKVILQTNSETLGKKA